MPGEPPFLLILLAPLAAMALLVLAITSLQRRQARKRRESVERKARSLPYGFTPQANLALVAELRQLLPRTHKQMEKVANILRGERHGLRFEMMDYSFVTGSSRQRHLHRQTVVRCRMGYAIPDFCLLPEQIFDQIGDFIGWRDIDFDHRPELSGRYFLKGKNESGIRALFTDRVLAQLEAEPEKLCVDGRGDSLLVYRGRGFVAAEELESYLDKCLAIVAAFRGR